MAIIYSYPEATPTLSDTVVGTQFDESGNPTKSFLISDIVDLAITSLPPGPTGPQGSTGPAGPIGPQGPTGSSGSAGPQGQQGVPGPVGPAGLNWQGAWSSVNAYSIDDAVGYNGASWFCIDPVGPSATPPDIDPTNWSLLASQGATGPQGPVGSTGSAGATGAQGPAGLTGAQGTQGIPGIPGSTGSQGPQGPVGPAGSQGLQGAAGTTGAQGTPGVPGPVGPAGLNWQGQWVAGDLYAVDDAVGYNGASYFCISANGSVIAPDLDTTNWALLASEGAIGPAGSPGPTGLTGAQGPAGNTGPAGPQGPIGPTGATGATGPAGSGGGITSLNALTNTTQILTTGVAGNNFSVVSSGNTHTFNLPDTSATSRGVLNIGAQTINGAKTFLFTPQAPTASLLANDTQLATTAWVRSIAGTSVGTILGAGTTNGATINAGILQLAPATLATGGIITTNAQFFAGIKTFSTKIRVPELALQQSAPHLPEGGYNAITADSGGYFYWLGNNAFASAYFNFNSITTGQKNFTFPNVTGTIALGVGNPNELAYWVNANTLGTLSTTGYPNLAEISYVKGVTSAIQTQLNAKQNNITLTTTGTSGAATLVGSTLNIPQYSGGSGIAWLESNAESLTVWNNGRGNVSGNTSFGEEALESNNALGLYNTAYGFQALKLNGGGSQNVAVGVQALVNVQGGSFNTGIGMNAARQTQTGSSNTAIGNNTLYNNSSSNGNTAIGSTAGYYGLGANNIYIGSNSGPSVLSVENNKLYISNISGTPLIGGDFVTNTVAINGSITATSIIKSGGISSQYLMADGSVTTGGGSGIAWLESNATDLTVWNNGQGNISTNTSFGDSALRSNTSGTDNTCYGQNAGYFNTSGNQNTFMGRQAGQNNSTGGANTNIGYGAGGNITIGGGNTMLGSQAGGSVIAGNQNTFIGRATGFTAQNASSGNIFIGYNAGPTTGGTYTNQLYINNANGTPLIGGDFVDRTVTIDQVLALTPTINTPIFAAGAVDGMIAVWGVGAAQHIYCRINGAWKQLDN